MAEMGNDFGYFNPAIFSDGCDWDVTITNQKDSYAYCSKMFGNRADSSDWNKEINTVTEVCRDSGYLVKLEIGVGKSSIPDIPVPQLDKGMMVGGAVAGGLLSGFDAVAPGVGSAVGGAVSGAMQTSAEVDFQNEQIRYEANLAKVEASLPLVVLGVRGTCSDGQRFSHGQFPPDATGVLESESGFDSLTIASGLYLDSITYGETVIGGGGGEASIQMKPPSDNCRLIGFRAWLPKGEQGEFGRFGASFGCPLNRQNNPTNVKATKAPLQVQMAQQIAGPPPDQSQPGPQTQPHQSHGQQQPPQPQQGGSQPWPQSQGRPQGPQAQVQEQDYYYGPQAQGQGQDYYYGQ
jgi:hypothetical protein